jgi:hypothetical protein
MKKNGVFTDQGLAGQVGQNFSAKSAESGHP